MGIDNNSGCLDFISLRECLDIRNDKKLLFFVVAFTCWNIWKDQCKAIFNHKPPFPIQTINSIVRVGEMFLKAKTMLHTPYPCRASSASAKSMDAPPPNMMKINVDASWNNNGCCDTIEVVMRDSGGRCLAVRRKEISAPTTFAVEALGVLEGYMLAK